MHTNCIDKRQRMTCHFQSDIVSAEFRSAATLAWSCPSLQIIIPELVWIRALISKFMALTNFVDKSSSHTCFVNWQRSVSVEIKISAGRCLTAINYRPNVTFTDETCSPFLCIDHTISRQVFVIVFLAAVTPRNLWSSALSAVFFAHMPW